MTEATTHGSPDGPFFVGTPFALTANRNAAACWAGRRSIKAKLERLCRSYTIRPDSSLDVIWANLGAGKSHALLHLIGLLTTVADDPKPISAYVEMPQQPRRFVDLYRQIILELPLEAVVPHLVAEDNKTLSEDLGRAARVLAFGGSDERALAREWLSAGRPRLRDLRTATGIGARIEDDLHAGEVFSQIVAGLAAHQVRTVVLIDEFQRVASSSQKQRDAILHNLRSTFSRNSAYLSVVLAVASRIEKSALAIMPQELRTLMGMRPTVSLPEMSEEEALEFLIERFRFFRPHGYSGSATAPFGMDALRMIVSHVAGADRERLIPRTLLQASAWVYDEALTKKVGQIDPVATERLLQELQWET